MIIRTILSVAKIELDMIVERSHEKIVQTFLKDAIKKKRGGGKSRKIIKT